MLYVLTWADIRAVSAEAWTDWKGKLLTTLYHRTRDIMLHDQTSEEYVKERVATVREAILKRMKARVNGEELEAFVKSISPRYLLAHTDEELLEHFTIITKHDDRTLLFKETADESDTMSEILLYTWSNPRLIPLVTGVMLALDVNILQMENFVLKDGHVFIKMGVQTSKKLSLKKAGLVETLREALQNVFTGTKNVDDLIARRKRPTYLNKGPVRREDPVIKVDNDVSAYYTVIDIYAHDRVGLLYDIITCLVEQGCYVDVSKISTKVEQVVDTFYVKDIFGHKILSKEKINEMKKSLADVVSTEGSS